MVVEAGLIGLYLRVPGIFWQGFRDGPQAQRPNVACPSYRDTGTFFPQSLKQPCWCGEYPARHGCTGLVPVMTKLEVSTGDPGTGGLPARPGRNVAKKMFLIGNVIHS